MYYYEVTIKQKLCNHLTKKKKHLTHTKNYLHNNNYIDTHNTLLFITNIENFFHIGIA